MCPMRILAIIHLCFVFTAIAWYAGYPFMGKYFIVKSKKSVVEAVMDDDMKFALLQDEKRSQIIDYYHHLQTEHRISVWEKLKEATHILGIELPFFEKAWIIFSIVIPVLLLLNVEGASQSIWILPLIVTLFVIDNQWNGVEPFLSEESKLFPSEEILVTEYLKEPLKTNILEQRDQLMHGWQLYLIREWAGEETSKNPEVFNIQLQKAEFAFNFFIYYLNGFA